MSSTDPVLGNKVHQLLKGRGLESPIDFTRREQVSGATGAHMLEAWNNILMAMGMDLGDDSIVKTPARMAKMFQHEIFYGMDYANFPKCSTFGNKMQYDEMICVKDILVRSVCEHHFVPFIGRAAIAYIPGERVVGLSKLNRVVDFFGRRPQVQERMTEQVAAALQMILKTEDVAVVIEAEHFCVKLRGVSDPHSNTVTSKLSGRFRSAPELRNEFLQLSKVKG